MLGQRVSNEQSSFGPTKYVAVGPTLNQRFGYGWRMVSVLAGTKLSVPRQVIVHQSTWIVVMQIIVETHERLPGVFFFRLFQTGVTWPIMCGCLSLQAFLDSHVYKL